MPKPWEGAFAMLSAETAVRTPEDSCPPLATLYPSSSVRLWPSEIRPPPPPLLNLLYHKLKDIQRLSTHSTRAWLPFRLDPRRETPRLTAVT